MTEFTSHLFEDSGGASKPLWSHETFVDIEMTPLDTMPVLSADSEIISRTSKDRLTQNFGSVLRQYMTTRESAIGRAVLEQFSALSIPLHGLTEAVTIERPGAPEALEGTPITLSRKPLIKVYWDDGREKDPARISIANKGKINAIRLGSALIRVHGDSTKSLQYEKCMVLATLGLPEKTIAKQLYLTENTVSTHMRRAFGKYNVKSRLSFALTCFEQDVYSVETPYTDLKLTAAEKPICVGIAFGLSDRLLAERARRSEDTIKTHVVNILKKNGLKRREQIALATLSSVPGNALF